MSRAKRKPMLSALRLPKPRQPRAARQKAGAAQAAALWDLTEEFAALYETTLDLAGPRDLLALLQAIVERAATLLGAPAGGIFLYDPAQDDLQLAVVKGPIELPLGMRLQLGEGMAGRVAQSRQPMIVDDYSAWPFRSPQFEGMPFTATVGVPMLYGGDLIGVLDVSEVGATARRFAEADARLLSLFAAHAAGAVQNARLLEGTRRRNAELAALNAVITAINAHQTLEQILSTALDVVLELIGAEAGEIFLLEAETQDLAMAMRRGPLAEPLLEKTCFHMGQGYPGLVAQSGRPLLVNGIRDDARFLRKQVVAAGFHSAACIPLHSRAQLVGTLGVFMMSQRPFPERDLELLLAIGEQVGIAIENARLFEALRESEERYRAVSELTTDFAFVFRVTPDGRFVYEWVGDAYTRISGFTPEETGALGGWSSLLHPNEMPKALQSVQKLLSGQPDENEFRIVTKQGDVRWLRIFGRPIRDETLGRVARIYGAAQDITERKRAEEALSRRARELEALSTFSSALRRARTREAMLPLLLDKAAELLEADAGALMLREGEALVFAAVRGWTEALRGRQHPPGDDPLWQMMRHGQAMFVGDAAERDDLGQWEICRMLMADWQAFACVPLKTAEATLGLLHLAFRQARTLTEGEIRLLTSIAEMAGNAIHRASLHEQTGRRANELAALYDTTRDLAVQQDLSALLQTIVERATMLMGAPAGVIYLYDAERGDLEAAVACGYLATVGSRLRLGEGMAGRVAQTHQPLIVDDYRTWPHRSSQYESAPYTAVVEVPMLYGGELIGVLAAHELGETTRKFAEADARLLALFAGQAASAVHNARLFDQTRRRLAELEALNRMSAALRTAQASEDMLPLLLDTVRLVLEAQHGALILLDASQERLTVVLAREAWAGLEGMRHSATEGVAGFVLATNTHYVTDDYQDDLHRTGLGGQLAIGPALAVLLRTRERNLGVLLIGRPRGDVARPARPFTAAEVQLAQTIAEMGGNAIHRATLHEQTQQRLQRLHALHAIDVAINVSLDLRATLHVLLDQVITQLRVDAADVLLLNPHTRTLEYAAGHGFRGNAIARTPQPLGEGRAGRAVLERRVVHIPHLTGAMSPGRRTQLLTNEESFIAYYAVPLIAKGEVKGLLELFHRAPLAPDPEWLDFLEVLGAQAAIAIDNAVMFDSVQRSNVELTLAYDATIEGWSRALEIRDRETEGHTQRVTELIERLARATGMSEEELVHIRRGALLHDIGKMGIPDSILLKPGTLTEEEMAIMRLHPGYAYEMLAPVAHLRPALDIPYCHHEKWDGTGYPRGLKGEQIPLAARLFAVVDVWDALCADRPYRPAWPEEKVREYIREQAGIYFDPQVVEAFLTMMEE